MKEITALLYHDFTALDALGRLPGYEIRYASLSGGPVSNEKGLTVETEALGSLGRSDILLVPGGMGAGSWRWMAISLLPFGRRRWNRRW